MIFDDFIMNFIAYVVSYGYLLVILLCVLKIILLLWFNKGNLIFAIKNFAYIQDDMVHSGDLDLKKSWSFFRKTYRVLSIIMYSSFITWFILFMLYHRISGTSE